MKLAIFSKTPLAAAPWELYKALKKYRLLEVRPGKRLTQKYRKPKNHLIK